MCGLLIIKKYSGILLEMILARNASITGASARVLNKQDSDNDSSLQVDNLLGV